MENLKVIQPVPEATKWVSSMLTVVKPGKVRKDKCQFKFKALFANAGLSEAYSGEGSNSCRNKRADKCT